MVYDWDNKEDICYRMYIEEKKSLEDIMEFMKVNHNFAPSKRAFQTQFKRWEFPSKQNPAHKNEALVARIRELWEKNTTQKEMLRILNQEDGFDIKERELMRVRTKNRWLLRVANGMKSHKNTEREVIDQLREAIYDDVQPAIDSNMMMETPVPVPAMAGQARAKSPELSPEVMAKRQERLNKLQAESAERWASRKRRRRTRGWAGLPADPPGPPRFPSETTIDESKAFLSLDNKLYRDIRTRFQRICEEQGVNKKTIAGPERWEAVKAQLIQESDHLKSVFWGNDESQDAKKLALDVVCTDVTKRMRTLERRMTIAEAKNALGINPEESRQIRNAFYKTLKDDHFTSKLEAGDEHWKELKAQWIEGSELLKNILAPGDSDPNHKEKVKAMEVLCRDVMKRLRDDQTKRDPTRKKKFDSNFTTSNANTEQDPVQYTSQDDDDAVQAPLQYSQASHNDHVNAHQYAAQDPNSMHAPVHYAQTLNGFHAAPHAALVHAAAQAQAQQDHQAQVHAHAQAQHAAQQQAHDQAMFGQADMQIDPSLLNAVNDPLIMDHDVSQYADQQYADQQYAAQAAQVAFAPAANPIAVYFRLHPDSQIAVDTRLWVSTLTTRSVEELRHLATIKYPNTVLIRLDGIVKEASGSEMSLQIDLDEELNAYLQAINGVKPIFAVQLMPA